MKEYIFTTRDDIYIIDLQKTMTCIENAYAAIKEIAQKVLNSGIAVMDNEILKLKNIS